MGQFIENLQYKLKTSSSSLLLMSFRIFVGIMLSLTLALVGERMLGYETFSFLLVVVTITAAFMHISRAWRWSHVMVFALMCVLIAVLLRMYIQVAPGA